MWELLGLLLLTQSSGRTGSALWGHLASPLCSFLFFTLGYINIEWKWTDQELSDFTSTSLKFLSKNSVTFLPILNPSGCFYTLHNWDFCPERWTRTFVSDLLNWSFCLFLLSRIVRDFLFHSVSWVLSLHLIFHYEYDPWLNFWEALL